MPYGPTPDFDRKTVAWAGVYLDGTPCTGTITIRYEGPVMLDDGTTPISVYPAKIVATLAPRTMDMTSQDGTVSSRTYGYAEFSVPASNDPDLVGSGGTYKIVEDLQLGEGLTKSVVVDKDAVGTIWLNKMTSLNPVIPTPTLTADGMVFTQPYSSTSRRVIPSGSTLMILGGTAAQKPVWALPGDLYAAVG